MQMKRICLLGGTGFVGRHLTHRLATLGMSCRVLTRRPHRHRSLLTAAGTELVETDVFDDSALQAGLRGCDAVINLIGILNEGRAQGFRRVHVELVERLVAACRLTGVRRLVHMSALNADESGGPSVYLRTKGEGENRAHTLGRPDIAVTSFRPSVIFGRDDSFVNRFATLLRIPGPLPLACPDARFAPIHINDLVSAMVASLTDRDTFGRRLDMCGPDEYRLEEIVRLIAGFVSPGKWIIRMPDGASRLQAAVLQFAPGKPFTPDNYLSMQVDSVCESNCLPVFGIQPTGFEGFLSTHFGDSGRQNRLMSLRRSG